MKKILALLLSLLILFSAVACMQETPEPQIPETPTNMPENALQLWEQINTAMDALDSMEMTISTQKTYYENGYRYNLATSRLVVSTRDIHYAQTTSTLGCYELDLLENMEVLEVYFDGKVYRLVSNGQYTQKLCSEMTHEEY